MWIAKILFVAGLVPLLWLLSASLVYWVRQYRWERREVLHQTAISYWWLLQERDALRDTVERIQAVQKKHANELEPGQSKELSEIQRSLDEIRTSLAQKTPASRESTEEQQRRAELLIRLWTTRPKPPNR
jgi:hypothetical protein